MAKNVQEQGRKKTGSTTMMISTLFSKSLTINEKLLTFPQGFELGKKKSN